jgi:phage host-nuclease inhibitor protein Gam
VQERHQEPMLALARQMEIREAGVFVYCQQHRAQLFPDKKSIDFLLAVVGFRANPASVEKCAKKDTWTAVAARLSSLKWGLPYVTEPAPEVNKRALLADQEKLTPEQLAEAGICFQQEEEFFITPKSEVASRTVLEAA